VLYKIKVLVVIKQVKILPRTSSRSERPDETIRSIPHVVIYLRGMAAILRIEATNSPASADAILRGITTPQFPWL
jgi:hypothetical protein